MSQVRIKYAGKDKEIVATIIKTWVRGEISRLVSSSSGPKEMIKNDVYCGFNQFKDVDRISMLRYQALTFMVIRKGGKYFDFTKRNKTDYVVGDEEIEVSAVKESPPGGQGGKR